MKKCLKIFCLFGMIIFIIIFFSACKKENEKIEVPKEKIIIKLGVPKAPPTLPLLRVIDSKALGENYDFQIEFWDSPEVLIGMVQSNQCDYFASPLTVTANLYNKGLGVRLTNIASWGGGSVLSTNKNIKDWKDLKGKTIYMTLKSTPDDVFTHYFLNRAGFKEGIDYEMIYSPMAEATNMMISGKVEIAMNIEPNISTILSKNPNVTEVINIGDEWKKLHDGNSLPGAGLITTVKFAEEHPDLVIKIEEEYAKALKWVIENPSEAALLGEKILEIKKESLEKAIPNMELKYVGAENAKEVLDPYYKAILDFDKKMIGGKIPDEKLYFKK
ncbi:ABC transporter substrate-binding protein [Fusobacterium simiae]|uniref:ABC transporter substrate-binding protein n=1 Tax=Fusobacterium simiae TaxID=855 RepID=A0ABT4DGJ8_FUSSI|nr:ABC transporter substrate-binding protein [Fusobacterium simiae]MCY7007717.1 ABC transporter substrate-binding protein [Fusobacterium simiae]